MEGKIVGGAYTEITKFPHAVFLSITCGHLSMICGGSIVNQHIILTAAHCLAECIENMSVDVYAGHENLREVTVIRNGLRTAIHKEFSEDTLMNDIALVLLSQKLPLNYRIKRVIIKRNHPEKLIACVAGWGITNDVTRERTIKLKMVEQPLHTAHECAIVGNLQKGMTCAGNIKDTSNRPSKGDSGSGLITSDHQQIGIVSFRNDNYPSLVVYTDVSYFYDWIHDISKKLYCSVRM
ncbi:duodenase-1-like [Epargyreus clarus]|uniref:duodenase-1-like n=1 Tax=Epargyreus clarus TaxID=520877 RepID=UPI003C2F0266